MNKKIKLFHFVSGLVGGGAQTQLLLLVKNIDVSLFENYVIYSNVPDYFVFEEYEKTTFIKISDFQINSKYLLTQDFVIHIWMPDVFTYLSPTFFLKYQNRVIIGIRNKYSLDSLKRWYQLFCFIWFNKFVSNTPFSIHKKIHQLVYNESNYNYIANATKYSISDNNFQLKCRDFLYVGRMVSQKGVMELIQAFNSIDRNYSLDMVGSGDLEEVLIKKCELVDNITFYGYLANPREKFQENRFFILPSYYEGMPNVAFEALSNNCMLLLSDIPQNRVWFNSDEVIYFESKSVVSLENALNKAIKLSKTQREEMVIRAKKVLKELTMEKYIEKYTKYYKKVVDENS